MVNKVSVEEVLEGRRKQLKVIEEALVGLRKEFDRIAATEKSLLFEAEIVRGVIADFEGVLEEVSKKPITRRHIDRSPEAVVDAKRALNLTWKVLQKAGATTPGTAMSTMEIFDAIVGLYPVWSESENSFSACLSTLHKRNLQGKKWIQKVKNGRLNLFYLKAPKGVKVPE